MGAPRMLEGDDALARRHSSIETGFNGWTSRNGLAYWARDEETDTKSHHLHFWVLVEPVERAVLRLFPLKKNSSISGVLRFSNPRGEVFNECHIATRPGQIAQLQVGSFLEECETDAGCQHAHLQLVTSEECHGEIEFSSRTRTSFLSPLHRLSEKEPRAFPVTLSEAHRHVVAIVNPNDVQCSVKCRLYVGTRTPEEVCLVPPQGTMLVSPEVLFGGIIDGPVRGEEKQAYLRLMTRSAKSLGFQVLEERSFESGEKVYGVIS